MPSTPDRTGPSAPDGSGSAVSDRAITVAVFVLLAIDGAALLVFPSPRTAAAVVLVTGSFVLLTQFREILSRAS